MSDFVSFTTDRRMRWDEVAQIRYGDGTKTEAIISANRGISLNGGLIPAGVNLLIPILEDTEVNDIPSNQKPPWAD